MVARRTPRPTEATPVRAAERSNALLALGAHQRVLQHDRARAGAVFGRGGPTSVTTGGVDWASTLPVPSAAASAAVRSSIGLFMRCSLQGFSSMVRGGDGRCLGAFGGHLR